MVENVMLACLVVCARGASLAVHEELTVASYNIRTASRWAVRDGGDGRNHRTWPARRSAVAKTIEIARASVVGTQEGLARQLDDLVSLLGPHWRCVGAGRVGDGSDEDETAGIVWDDRRVELLESGDFWLSETPEVRGSKSWGASLPRVATWAAFAVRGHEGRFAVVNAHLDHLSERARFESAKLLATRANALADDGTRAVFVTGDFNAVKTERWYEAIADGARFVDAWIAATSTTCGVCGQSTYHGWLGGEAPSANWIKPHEGPAAKAIALSGERHIDAVFVSTSALGTLGTLAQARVVTDDKRKRAFGGPFASDHYPVVVTFRWQPHHTARAQSTDSQTPDL